MSYNWPLKDMFTGFDPKKKFNNMTLSYYNKHFRKPRQVIFFFGIRGADRSVGRRTFSSFPHFCVSLEQQNMLRRFRKIILTRKKKTTFSFKPVFHVCMVVGVTGYLFKHYGHFSTFFFFLVCVFVFIFLTIFSFFFQNPMDERGCIIKIAV